MQRASSSRSLLERNGPILRLRSPLACLSGQPGRTMREDHRSLDFVAILPPGAGASRSSHLALTTQGLRVKRSGMIGPRGSLSESIQGVHASGHSAKRRSFCLKMTLRLRDLAANPRTSYDRASSSTK